CVAGRAVVSQIAVGVVDEAAGADLVGGVVAQRGRAIVQAIAYRVEGVVDRLRPWPARQGWVDRLPQALQRVVLEGGGQRGRTGQIAHRRAVAVGVGCVLDVLQRGRAGPAAHV